eukprot:3298285-Pyramimonas_sp.AAC.1
MICTHVATSSFEYLTKYRASGSASPFHDFSALVWHMRGGGVVLICTYLARMFGLTKGPNVKTLRALVSFVGSLAD